MQTRSLVARLTERRFRVGVATLSVEPKPAILRSNEIARARFVLAEPLAFDAYDDNRATGAFIMIDEVTNATVAAGMIARPKSDASPPVERGFDVGL